MSSCSTCVKVLSGGTGRVYKQRRAEGIRKRRMLEIQPYQITLDMSVFSTQTTVKHLHESLNISTLISLITVEVGLNVEGVQKLQNK